MLLFCKRITLFSLSINRNDKITSHLIKQEKQLLDKTDPLDVLADLIDDEFIAIGSSSTIHNKTEVVRWLARDDQSVRLGTSFKYISFQKMSSY